MLTLFKLQHAGLMDSHTRRELYKRGAGILVRPGNPKKINSLKISYKARGKIIRDYRGRAVRNVGRSGR